MASKRTSKPFPGFDHLWKMHCSGSRQEPLIRFDEPYTTASYDLVPGDNLPQGPLIARWFLGGRKLKDIMWPDIGTPVISDRVVEGLRANKLTGWATHPVDVYGRDQQYAGRYHMLYIKGRCGPVAWERSERIRVAMPACIVIEVKGFFFDETTWDGSDFFLPRRSGSYWVVTDAVVKTFKQLKIRHVRFERLDEYMRPLFPGEENYLETWPLPDSPEGQTPT